MTCKYFLPGTHVFVLLTMSFEEQAFLMIKSSLLIFSFMGDAFGVVSMKFCLNQGKPGNDFLSVKTSGRRFAKHLAHFSMKQGC